MQYYISTNLKKPAAPLTAKEFEKNIKSAMRAMMRPRRPQPLYICHPRQKPLMHAFLSNRSMGFILAMNQRARTHGMDADTARMLA